MCGQPQDTIEPRSGYGQKIFMLKRLVGRLVKEDSKKHSGDDHSPFRPLRLRRSCVMLRVGDEGHK